MRKKKGGETVVTALLARLLLGKKKDFFTILKIKGTAYMISIQPYVSSLEAFKKAVNSGVFTADDSKEED